MKQPNSQDDTNNLKAVFIAGIAKSSQLESLNLKHLPRIAFAGRSNVGKSSLLNALTKQKIARVSAEPGKTREMNFFLWKKLYLVDLPGYGYAKVSKTLRNDWGNEIQKWLEEDEFLSLVVSLVDGRHSFQKQDLELVDYLQSNNIPYVVAFTKMDKYKSSNKRRNAERDLAKDCDKYGVQDYVYVSSMDKNGLTELYRVINSI